MGEKDKCEYLVAPNNDPNFFWNCQNGVF